ncbi:Mor transcription activator family protein [Snodgrassella sp. CFCC 13594]|uniref:Mor transcription activator family protein n=1 Tax=Snodgrassella sp. CFCC 13594 TaxID=1775559 RepID=UPI000832A57A|nr:Mor transcription activator family protein [Snodgrassella sp. CFCC 13594]
MTELELAKQHLPAIVCDIAEIIGFPATEALVKAIGGTSFAFGVGIRETERLRILYRAIGEQKTHQLLSVFRGSRDYIPRCEKALRLLRNARFKNDYLRMTELDGASGVMAIQTLCPKYNISDRTAYDIIRSHTDPVTHQRDLF